MVKVEIDYHGKSISKILVKGHANTAPYGQDLVCAAVSAICTGAMNALEDSSVINEKILDSSDKDAFENRYNLCSSIAKWLGNFYDSSVNYNTPYSFS